MDGKAPDSLTDVPLDSLVQNDASGNSSAEENRQNEAAATLPAPPSAYPQQQVFPPSTTVAEATASQTEEKLVAPHFKDKKGQFYSAKPGVYERALEEIKRECYNANVDGANLLGAWLLLEVDHWDTETEKVVLLYDETLLTVRYDFIPMKIYKAKKLFLRDVDTIKRGPFKYPKYSICNLSPDFRSRPCDGVRIMWNKGVEPTFLEKWNASSMAMPWQTFTYHPLYDDCVPKEKDRHDVMHFMDQLVAAVNATHSRRNDGIVLNLSNEPLQQDVYLGFLKQIHNDSFLGMSKERGGFSF